MPKVSVSRCWPEAIMGEDIMKGVMTWSEYKEFVHPIIVSAFEGNRKCTIEVDDPKEEGKKIPKIVNLGEGHPEIIQFLKDLAGVTGQLADGELLDTTGIGKLKAVYKAYKQHFDSLHQDLMKNIFKHMTTCATLLRLQCSQSVSSGKVPDGGGVKWLAAKLKLYAPHEQRSDIIRRYCDMLRDEIGKYLGESPTKTRDRNDFSSFAEVKREVIKGEKESKIAQDRMRDVIGVLRSTPFDDFV